MKSLIRCMIAGALLVAIGLVVFIVGLGINGWQMSPHYTDEIWTQTSDSIITYIDIDFAAGEFNTVLYDGDEIQIEYQTCDMYYVKINQNYDKLTIETNLKVPLLFGGIKAPKMTLKIPDTHQLEIFNLKLKAGKATIEGDPYYCYGVINTEVNAGALDFIDMLRCEELNINIKAGAVSTDIIEAQKCRLDVSAGSAYIGELRCYKTDINVSAGSVEANLDGLADMYNIVVHKSAGSCNLTTNVYAPGTRPGNLNIDVSAGSVYIKFTTVDNFL